MIRAAPRPLCAPSRGVSVAAWDALQLRVRLFPRNACRADCSLAPPQRCEAAAQGASEGAVGLLEIERSERTIHVINIDRMQ
jgi:hypothetical protein